MVPGMGAERFPSHGHPLPHGGFQHRHQSWAAAADMDRDEPLLWLRELSAIVDAGCRRKLQDKGSLLGIACGNAFVVRWPREQLEGQSPARRYPIVWRGDIDAPVCCSRARHLRQGGRRKKGEAGAGEKCPCDHLLNLNDVAFTGNPQSLSLIKG